MSTGFINSSRITSYACVLFLCTAAITATKANSAQDNDEGTTPIVEFKSGKIITASDLREFSGIMGNMQGPRAANPQAFFPDLILANCWSDISTTLPALEKHDQLTMDQNVFLRDKLFQDTSAATTVTKEIAEKWYKENSARYARKEQVKGRHLFLQTSDEVPTSAPDIVKGRIENIRKEISDGKISFTDAVDKYSESSTRQVHGDLGYLTYRQPIGKNSIPMNIILDSALFSLKPGEISPVLLTKAGYHLLFCEDKLTTHTPSIEELTTSGILPNAAQQMAATEKLDEMLSSSKIKHDIKLAKLPENKADITTATVLMTVGDKTFNADQVEALYGNGFLKYFLQVISPEDKNTTGTKRPVMPADALDKLMEQLANIQAISYLVTDQMLDKKYATQIDFLQANLDLQKAFDKILTDYCTVDSSEVKNFYDANLENPEFRFYRRPLYEGYVVSLSGTEDQAKTELAKLKSLSGKELETEIASVSTDDRKTSNGLVPMHVVGSLTDEPARQFDMFAANIKAGEWIDKPQKLSNGWLLVKVTKKEKGEPTPFETVKASLSNYLQQKKLRNFKQNLLLDAQSKGLFTLKEGAKELHLDELINNLDM